MYDPGMRIAITGASGMVGQAVTAALRDRGDDPVAVVRAGDGEIRWSRNGFAPSGALSGFDAVIHLAGESIGSGRWSEAHMHRIRESRVGGTQAVVQALREANPRPRTFVCASAVGYYGDAGDQVLPDDAPPGDTFLAQVVHSWEHEASAAERLGVRTAMARFGIILSPQGGALRQMLPAFRLGLGGRLGDGGHYMSWIHLADAVRGVLHALDGHIDGPFNCLAPAPVTNREFTRVLAKVLHRPAVVAVPRFVLRLVLGKLADAGLESQRATPQRLPASGFEFRFPELKGALVDLLGPSPRGRATLS